MATLRLAVVLFQLILQAGYLDADTRSCCDEVREGNQAKFEITWHDKQQTSACLRSVSAIHITCASYPNYKATLDILDHRNVAKIVYNGRRRFLFGEPSFNYSLHKSVGVTISNIKNQTAFQLSYQCDYANGSRRHSTPQTYIRFISTEVQPCPAAPEIGALQKRTYAPDGDTVFFKCSTPRVGYLGVRFEGKQVFGFGANTRDELKMSRQDLEDQIAPYELDVTDCSSASQSCCQIKASVKMRNDDDRFKVTLHFLCFSDTDNGHAQRATSVTWYPQVQFSGTEAFAIHDNTTNSIKIIPPHPLNEWNLSNYGFHLREEWMFNGHSLSDLSHSMRSHVVIRNDGLQIRKNGLVFNGNVAKVYRLVSADDESAIRNFVFQAAVHIESPLPSPLHQTSDKAACIAAVVVVVVAVLLLIVAAVVIVRRRQLRPSRDAQFV